MFTNARLIKVYLLGEPLSCICSRFELATWHFSGLLAVPKHPGFIGPSLLGQPSVCSIICPLPITLVNSGPQPTSSTCFLQPIGICFQSMLASLPSLSKPTRPSGKSHRSTFPSAFLQPPPFILQSHLYSFETLLYSPKAIFVPSNPSSALQPVRTFRCSFKPSLFLQTHHCYFKTFLPPADYPHLLPFFARHLRPLPEPPRPPEKAHPPNHLSPANPPRADRAGGPPGVGGRGTPHRWLEGTRGSTTGV